MKTIINLLCLTMIFSAYQVNKSKNYETECISTAADGFINIKIWNTQRGARYSQIQAKKDAIHAILFSGISAGNGCITQPPILINLEEKENFKRIEKHFFSKKGYWSLFTRSADTKSTLPNSIGPKHLKVYQISIAKNELRKYLEEQKIISKLNNGF